jgi:vacuolar-type H+-ATPase subunit C/Vma6
VINMSLSSDLLYITPKLRVIYSTCLNEKNIQDLLQANSIDDYMYILKETSYYQYLKNIDPKDLLSLVVGFECGLCGRTKIFD